MKYLYFVVGIIAAVVTFIILFAIDTVVSSIWMFSTSNKMKEKNMNWPIILIGVFFVIGFGTLVGIILSFV